MVNNFSLPAAFLRRGASHIREINDWWRHPMSNSVPETTPSLRSRLILVAVGIGSIAGLLALGVYTWLSLGAVEMSTNGYIALVLGTIGTLALGGGLMTLVFYSQRHGYDDAAAGNTPEDEQH
jgi:hypothetical protein